MWRGSVGWRNIMHVIGGIIKYSIKHPGQIFRRRYHSRKLMGVGSY